MTPEELLKNIEQKLSVDESKMLKQIIKRATLAENRLIYAEERIKDLTQALDKNAMVDRFLSWELPRNFSPDAGITFTHKEPYPWPVGTNLLDANQTMSMFMACVPPTCFGLDDCSSNLLMHCKWAKECSECANRAFEKTKNIPFY